ncbi:ABC transporter ATP-binding protein [Mesorhizobium sp.]|uniref:ABC transporter ATP-binding protein n=1 Tax=Mesorhizobium sp. TaxID=1871066 RepID=UPI000FE2EE5C|nr:ABC transporter ATP-binding protein [Mesorhizobium sp.]RWH69335.1 MAG: ABC transporter ATP-binding protein [Mesorhizobium sp.]RWL27822.1 MAG: ABC transporter ATP-binding protein [Mesorhizobium sp.]RWL29131.1 MAG: ABC transporter ATP-binding protein [Mesorhizobium sp.]RWL37277.1 MAG: ABC transporter ATP-binding protein [Mesorhizobium sp.]RWL55612.1 MAG: ABC transporter ATP-binding protein [Mesorhizobium sp.]
MTISQTIFMEGVSKRYGDSYVVRDVDLSIAPGECVAIVGHNGAGKSTLVKMALGLITPTAGRIALLGENPAGRHAMAFRSRIGFLPENVAFSAAMTGREVLRFYARLKQVPLGGADRLLERVGLAAAARRRVGTYSKGMRQRLGLAQALLGEPRVLFLDEPTTGLDIESRQMFYDVMAELRDAGATLLLSSHALSDIEQADRIAIMKAGRMLACGALPELRRLADLPLRIRVHVVDGNAAREFTARRSVQWLDDLRFEMTCADDGKVEAIRSVSLLQGVRDIEVMPPTLVDLCDELTREAAE